MKSENREFLDANRHHYITLVKAGYVQHLDYSTRENLLRVIHEEFTPDYMGQLWCQSCIADMLMFAYKQYDKWIKEDKILNGDGPGVHLPGILDAIDPNRDHVRMTFPIQEPEEPKTE